MAYWSHSHGNLQSTPTPTSTFRTFNTSRQQHYERAFWPCICWSLLQMRWAFFLTASPADRNKFLATDLQTLNTFDVAWPSSKFFNMNGKFLHTWTAKSINFSRCMNYLYMFLVGQVNTPGFMCETVAPPELARMG